VKMDIDIALNELLLTRPVTKAQIERAYHRMARKFQPDKATEVDEKSWVHKKFLRIQQAYELLTDLPIKVVNKAVCQPDADKPRQTSHRQSSNESPATRPSQGGKECQADKPRQTSHRQSSNESAATRPTRGGKECQEALLFKWSLIACGVILIVALLFRHQPGTATANNAGWRAPRLVPIPDRPTTTADVGGREPHVVPDWEATTTNNAGARDLSTPSGRLVGHWRNEPYYTELYFTAVPPSLKWGTMIRHPFLTMIRHNRGADPLPTASIEVLFEECSGNTVGVKECAQEVDSQIRLEAVAGSDLSDLAKSGLLYSISEDGQTMTEESVLLGTQHLETYRYVDSRTAP
jgi:curved DNA-binding protein CbpA